MLEVGELLKSNEALLDRIFISLTSPLQNGNSFPNIACGTSAAPIAASYSKGKLLEKVFYRKV
jgi:hypothetical protein